MTEHAAQPPACPVGDSVTDSSRAGLVMMLIEFDALGRSVGTSWDVTDPAMAAHLRHLSTHLGEPLTSATDEQARDGLRTSDSMLANWPQAWPS